MVNEEYTLERFKRFIELLGNQHPTAQFLKKFAEHWQREQEQLVELIRKNNGNG